MGFSEKSGSPFFILKKVERNAKNEVDGAKTVQKTCILWNNFGKNNI